MDLWEAVKIVARHWVIVASGLVVAAAVTVVTFQRTEPTYRASGTAIVVPSQAPTDAATQQVLSNPYATLGGPLTTTAQVLADVARGTEVEDEVRDAGGTAGYLVVSGIQAPTLSITAEGDDAATVIATVEHVLTIVGEDFEARQAATGVPPDLRLRLDVVAAPTKAIVANGARLQATGIVAGLATIAALSLAFLLEATGAARRARRRAATRAEPAHLLEAANAAPPTRSSDAPTHPLPVAEHSAPAPPTRSSDAPTHPRPVPEHSAPAPPNRSSDAPAHPLPVAEHSASAPRWSEPDGHGPAAPPVDRRPWSLGGVDVHP